MNKLCVSFLWHMHQPNYRDPIRGFYSMPWVRLHAVKAYYDMAVLAGKYPEMGLTFNLVPVLLKQIEDYTQGAVDYELIKSKKNHVDITEDENEAILTPLSQAQHKNLKQLHPRYMEFPQ